MTVGEMKKWTERYKEIVKGNGRLKDSRLGNLMTDLERAYDIPMLRDDEFVRNNPFVIRLYKTVSEARSI